MRIFLLRRFWGQSQTSKKSVRHTDNCNYRDEKKLQMQLNFKQRSEYRVEDIESRYFLKKIYPTQSI